jgi:hypothetical protein
MVKTGRKRSVSKSVMHVARDTNWQDITGQLRQPVNRTAASASTKLHDRVVSIMGSMDPRYHGLGDIDSKGQSSLTGWANAYLNFNRQLCVMGCTYNSEGANGIVRRVFGVTYTSALAPVPPNPLPVPLPDAPLGNMTNLRIEMLGICRDCAAHHTPADWEKCFDDWFEDLRNLILTKLTNSPSLVVRAIVPDTTDWTPMQEFQAYMMNSFSDQGLINSTRPLGDDATEYSLTIQP